MSNQPKASDSAPIWVREKRRPTREELAAKHFADGGGMGAPPPDPELDAFWHQDAETPAAPIVKRFK
jgi:hypothetical protein